MILTRLAAKKLAEFHPAGFDALSSISVSLVYGPIPCCAYVGLWVERCGWWVQCWPAQRFIAQSSRIKIPCPDTYT